MSGKARARVVAALVLNSLVLVLEVVSTPMVVSSMGLGMFQFYTEDSNYLMLAASLVLACLYARRLVDGRAVPRWAMLLKYLATTCLVVTFVVVVAVLAPIMSASGQNGYQLMLASGSMPYRHLLCPAIAFVSFVFLDDGPSLRVGDAWLALVPTLAYACVAVAGNVARLMVGPYPFLRVYEQPVWASVLWCLLVVGGAYLLARGLLALRSRNRRETDA
ncbi:MAG: hypothetical protein WAY93_09825 [Atopobiaceae bacterium]|jgi:hypothetical protein|nr:hypothetical protein [Atopobiaceae bacterium]